MIIITSIYPGNKAAQDAAIESQKKIGTVYSINPESEIQTLDNIVHLVPTHRIVTNGKELVSINAMIDFAIKMDQDVLIINSDIILKGFPDCKLDGITIFSRYDFLENIENSTRFEPGFDAFFIPKELLKIFPPSEFAMGSPFWDYWIPKVCINKNIPIYDGGKYAFHKTHDTNYNYLHWLRIGEYFKWVFNMEKTLTIPEVARKTLAEINSKLIA